MSGLVFEPVPRWATGESYPEIATLSEQMRLPFYCINCYHKRPTAYLTPNFGPFCADCLKEIGR